MVFACVFCVTKREELSWRNAKIQKKTFFQLLFVAIAGPISLRVAWILFSVENEMQKKLTQSIQTKQQNRKSAFFIFFLTVPHAPSLSLSLSLSLSICLFFFSSHRHNFHCLN
jgi:uncharacterized membrane protein